VIGLTPTNVGAQDLNAEGFSEAATVHAARWLKNGRRIGTNALSWWWTRRRCWTAVSPANCWPKRGSRGRKVILTGDDRPLASIECRGLLIKLRQQHDAVARSPARAPTGS
jgi:hypothetical protein